MTRKLERRRTREIWIAWIRLFAVPWAVLEVATFTVRLPVAR